MQIVEAPTTTRPKARLSSLVILGVSFTKYMDWTAVAIRPNTSQQREPRMRPGAMKPSQTILAKSCATDYKSCAGTFPQGLEQNGL
eukprot:CAMPEP_0115614956 /NCGR_PEP_ID=MMETSP0272-20121206/22376_1 /TAXON_ID=71861 /ORGANISM="Scrippsiella trochoidea, Strain CCMP3099" /LENGTH=85 /DNA_ID=CAMNT_0003050857 /DNA_START=148 /DNA_END=402 /DNA_ORIENTATION=+